MKIYKCTPPCRYTRWLLISFTILCDAMPYALQLLSSALHTRRSAKRVLSHYGDICVDNPKCWKHSVVTYKWRVCRGPERLHSYLNIAADDPSSALAGTVFLLLSIVRAKILVRQYIRGARHECGLPFDSVKYEAIKGNGPRRPAQLPITL